MDRLRIAFDLTAWFETSGRPFTLAVGDFDGQGCSWGPRQTCIGQGSLQPLMRKMLEADRSGLAAVLGPLFKSFESVAQVAPTESQLDTVRREWNDGKKLRPEWQVAFSRLGQLPAVQQIFRDEAASSAQSVDALASWIAGSGPVTVRVWCLAYDFITQNGGFHPVFRAAISTFLAALAMFRKDDRDRLRAICWLRSGWTYIRGQRAFADGMLDRKLLIVEGAAKFRGDFVDIDERFGVSDEVLA